MMGQQTKACAVMEAVGGTSRAHFCATIIYTRREKTREMKNRMKITLFGFS